MLQAHHDENKYTTIFSAKKESGEVVSSIYKKINGWVQSQEGRDDLAGVPVEEILEIIDRIRIPLAEKKFDALELTAVEESRLEILESLVDKILNALVAMPEESVEVKMALQHAKRITHQI